MSNEDEDEVEEELERMEKEAIAMPNIPSQPLLHEVDPGMKDDDLANHAMPEVPKSIESEQPERLQKQRERARARKVALHA